MTLTAPNLDIYIIPDASAENGYGSGRKLFIRPLLPSVCDLLITAGILSCITLIGFFFLQLDFARYNIIMLYMLGEMCIRDSSRALSLFWNWLRSFWHSTTVPVGMWVTRMALDVLLMC